MRIRYQFELIQTIRDFFKEKNFLETLTPPMVQNPGMETHIHPFQVRSVVKKENLPFYLHTSPEFAMKELLSQHQEEDFKNIYQISYVFRDEPETEIHRQQFLMLEWYRVGANYFDIMDDTIELVQKCQNKFKEENYPFKNIDLDYIEKVSVQELFLRELNIDILEYLEKDSLINLLKTKFPDVPLPQTECAWDDYYFLLFLNKIEPTLENGKAIILYDFPAPLAALSKIKENDSRVCERFELYINGVEICNTFTELTNLSEQQKRFNSQNQEMKKLYQYELPEPTDFYQAMEKGLPECSGNALGVERLLYGLLELSNPFYR